MSFASISAASVLQRMSTDMFAVTSSVMRLLLPWPQCLHNQHSRGTLSLTSCGTPLAGTTPSAALVPGHIYSEVSQWSIDLEVMQSGLPERFTGLSRRRMAHGSQQGVCRHRSRSCEQVG
eukprot:6488804-Amphidinium_carterae.1